MVPGRGSRDDALTRLQIHLTGLTQMTLENRTAQIPVGLRRTLVPLSLVGMSGVLLTFWFGFEEPNVWLAALSAAMLMAAPLAVVLHLACTRTLSPAERRVWWHDLASGEVWSALSEYLSSANLSASAQRRAIAAAGRGLRKT